MSDLGTPLFSVTTRGGKREDVSPLQMVSDEYLQMLEKRNVAIKEMLRAIVRPEGQYDGLRSEPR